MSTYRHRPGVYSTYSISPRSAAAKTKAHAAFIRVNAALSPGYYPLEQPSEAQALLSSDPEALGAVQILLSRGVAVVHCYLVDSTNSYSEVLDLIRQQERVGVVLFDSEEIEPAQAVLASVTAASEAYHERIGICSCAQPAQASAVAATLNHERMVVCCGTFTTPYGAGDSALYGGAALAAEVLALPIGNRPLNGCVMKGLSASALSLSERDVEALLEAGVTVFENIGGSVECIKAVTSKTTTSGINDRNLSSLNAILSVDEVVGGIRGSLRLRLKGARNNAMTRKAIASQTIVELACYQDMGLIESYDTPRVFPWPDDSSICGIELNFSIALVIDSIQICANIRI